MSSVQGNDLFPLPGERSRARLRLHNARWQGRAAAWRRYAPPPWWQRGLRLTPAWRGSYEAWLPVADFYADLRVLAASFLPSVAWTPAVLRSAQYHTASSRVLTAPLSLPDLWATWPDSLAGRVVFAADELLALFCALAEPMRFGTDACRYPEQMAMMEKMFREHAASQQQFSLLDIGCGTGLNTLEMATLGQEILGNRLQVKAITAEPLEAWMARCRRLPHDQNREKRLQRFAADLPVTFAAKSFQETQLTSQIDLIVCNGLAGGDFLHVDSDLEQFLRLCQRNLKPGGQVLLANRFHDGRRATCEKLRQLAAQFGFSSQGKWNNAVLHKIK